MNQIKIFTSESELNKWLEKYKNYEIMDIKYQFAPANYHRFIVWYKK